MIVVDLTCIEATENELLASTDPCAAGDANDRKLAIPVADDAQPA